MKKIFSRALSGVATLASATALVAANCAPASASEFIAINHCVNSYDCLVPFKYTDFRPAQMNIRVLGGVHEPISFNVDFTDAGPCHPTVYPGQQLTVTCNGLFPGNFRLYAYAGHQHEYYISLSR
ncbi:hypothetical protein AB5J62_36030 [Amycolatopsis sp. cg5]|uniref:hypothetical protein n=1 Tax=Amycolatopsis sp. cg5 TaxID=3238802 RepID=UPI003524A1AC